MDPKTAAAAIAKLAKDSADLEFQLAEVRKATAEVLRTGTKYSRS